MHLIIDCRTIDDHFPGIARYTYELVLALLRVSDLRLSIVLPSSPQTRFELAPLLQQAHVLRCDAHVFGVAQHWQVGQLVRHAGADVALFPYYVRPLWTPCPAVTVIHDAISWRVPEAFSRAKRLQIRLLHHLAIARSAHLLTVSHSAAADLVQFYSINPARLSITFEGAGAQFRPQAPDTIAALRQRYNLPNRYIVYVASDKPHKNIPFLLDSWRNVSAGDVGLVLAGRWFDPTTEQLLDDSLRGRVWRVPDVPEAELPALYGGALALAFPSRYEGFGLPPLEALACGTPVVAANNSALPEVVGAAGVLLPLDAQQWRATLERICHDETWRQQLADRTLAQAARFSWHAAAQRVIEVCQRVI